MLRPITQVASALDLDPARLRSYGQHMAKVLPGEGSAAPGKLVLVSAITPTPAGEGKTTTSIGLAQGMVRRGRRAVLALREPSLGPVFGVKGGGCGGGASTLEPLVDINLHFTGDIHAVGSAHNLLAAMADNALMRGDAGGLDPRRMTWTRVVDMNDRALRQVILGLGGPTNGYPRETRFEITAASEIMAILALAEDSADLERRLGDIVVGYAGPSEPVRASQLGAPGSMAVLLKDAIHPNLVQTGEGVPAFVHAGPFANIAHGCNSVRATRMALASGDYAITEAGFAFDLGAEKFLDIKCRQAGLWPDALVLVATVRALKMHGGVSLKQLTEPNIAALEAGMGNLEAHISAARSFGLEPVVAVNKRADDSPEEIATILRWCQENGLAAAEADPYGTGGSGCEGLAELVETRCAEPSTAPQFTYGADDSLEDKLAAVAKKIYGADGVELTGTARRDLRRLEKMGFGALPVCIAKTQSSLSDDPSKLGRPRDFTVTVRELKVSAGAGFIVALTGELTTMPGLSKRPAALNIGLDEDGAVFGVK